MKRVAAIIPARGGSKGVHRKNVRTFCGRPLLAHTIQAAIDASCVNEVFVSTEDREIAAIAGRYGALVIDRPNMFATDTASTFSVLHHACETIGFPEIVVVLQPTSPLRGGQHIDEAFLLMDESVDTVVAVCEIHLYMWREENGYGIPEFEERKPRQAMKPQYRENGALYITRGKVIEANDSKMGMGISSTGNRRLYVMDEHFACDIDSEYDFKLVEQIKKLNWQEE